MAEYTGWWQYMNNNGAAPTYQQIWYPTIPTTAVPSTYGNVVIYCSNPPIYKEPEAVKPMTQFVVAKYSDESKTYERTTLQVSVSVGPNFGTPAALLTEKEQEEIAEIVAKKLGLKFLGKA